MTLPALDQWIAKGVKGPSYKVGPRCANPQCERIAEHAHHILRRSYLAGVYDWVEIEDWVVGNKTGLCARCHDDVTGDVGGHKAAIRIDLAHRVFQWCLVADYSADTVDYIFAGLLDPQPPTPESLSSERATGHPESETCPTCGHSMRARRVSSGGARRARKSWPVLVPDDEQEHGADVLDALVENLVPLIPNADSSRTGRYYVLVPVLAYATMNSENFVATMEGVGG